jgi:putative flavoprotein involved in K+ transport
MTEQIDTAVIGGGQAGLAMSYHLKRIGREHVVLERARVAERWRTERWDSLTFQFPNASIQLPGHSYQCTDPDGFAPKDDVVGFFEDYADRIAAPLRCGVEVTALRQAPASPRLLLDTSQGALAAENVVVATGPFQLPLVPAFGTSIPATVFQVHSRDYRNPGQLPPGAVLVVGSANSGAQIAEELHDSGRKVYLAVGRHHRAPRRYRGRDFYWWLDDLGYWHTPFELAPEIRGLRFVVTGAKGGHDINLRRFAADGMTLLGRLRGASDGKLLIADDLEENLAQGDAWFASFKAKMDDYARTNGLLLPEDSQVETQPSALPAWSRPTAELDLRAAGISSIVWATGYRYDFGWIKLPVLNDAGEAVHHRGVSNHTGLYFLGLRRTYALSSALLSGVGNDAAYLADHIAGRQ